METKGRLTNLYQYGSYIIAMIITLFAINVQAVDLYVSYQNDKGIYVEPLLSNTPDAPIPWNIAFETASIDAPSIEPFGGNLFMAYTRGLSFKSVTFAWSQDTSYWPYHSFVDTAYTSHRRPQLQAYGTTLYAAYTGYNTRQIYIMSSADGVNWGQTGFKGASSTTDSTPGMTEAFGNLFLVYRSNRNNGMFLSSFDGKTWSAVHGAPGQTSGAPYIIAFKDKIFLAYRGNKHNNLYINDSKDGTTWSNQRVMNSNWRSNFGPAMAVYNNELYYVFITTAGSIAYAKSTDGVNWNGPYYKPLVYADGLSLDLAVY